MLFIYVGKRKNADVERAGATETYVPGLERA
jgi:hypothetical protein